MPKITLKRLEDLHACKEGKAFFVRKWGIAGTPTEGEVATALLRMKRHGLSGGHLGHEWIRWGCDVDLFGAKTLTELSTSTFRQILRGVAECLRTPDKVLERLTKCEDAFASRYASDTLYARAEIKALKAKK